MKIKMNLVEDQLNCQVMKTSRSNTFGKKYSRINHQRPSYEGTNAMNYIKVNAFSAEMFSCVKFLNSGGATVDNLAVWRQV
jgi:hypothetical protein